MQRENEKEMVSLRVRREPEKKVNTTKNFVAGAIEMGE